MKRTCRSWFVAVGTVDEHDPVVDKRRTWGKAFTERVAAELAGQPEMVSCDPCDVNVGAGRAWYGHVRSKRHRCLTGQT